MLMRSSKGLCKWFLLAAQGSTKFERSVWCHHSAVKLWRKLGTSRVVSALFPFQVPLCIALSSVKNLDREQNNFLALTNGNGNGNLCLNLKAPTPSNDH